MTAVPTILAAAVTDVGRVRKNNEDAHWVDADAGFAIVCDGMGGHQAGEVASQLAVSMVRERWRASAVEQARIAAVRTNTPAARHALVLALRDAVLAANEAIVTRSDSESGEEGMGTTFLGVCFLAGEAVFCHAGDSRAYLVRDGAATLLTEDHTLLARLADAGVETGPDANRWKGVVTNALGVGEPTWVATSALRLADGDRLLLCSDGVSEYFSDADIATVLTKIPSPAKAARKLVDLALDRGGQDNATAVVIKVVEVGVAPELRAADEAALAKCPLLADLGVPRRLRVLRMATEHAIEDNEPLPPRFLGDRVAWIILAGQVHRGGARHKAGGLLYPECLVAGGDGAHAAEWVARGPVRAIAIRADDLGELANDEPDVGEKVYASLAAFVGTSVR